MDARQFAELSKKMDIVIKLLASNVVQGKNLTQQAAMLSAIGLEIKDIALILDKDPHLISQTLYRVNKSKSGKEETK